MDSSKQSSLRNTAAKTSQRKYPYVPYNCQWSTDLRNDVAVKGENTSFNKDYHKAKSLIELQSSIFNQQPKSYVIPQKHSTVQPKKQNRNFKRRSTLNRQMVSQQNDLFGLKQRVSAQGTPAQTKVDQPQVQFQANADYHHKKYQQAMKSTQDTHTFHPKSEPPAILKAVYFKQEDCPREERHQKKKQEIVQTRPPFQKKAVKNVKSVTGGLAALAKQNVKLQRVQVQEGWPCINLKALSGILRDCQLVEMVPDRTNKEMGFLLVDAKAGQLKSVLQGFRKIGVRAYKG